MILSNVRYFAAALLAVVFLICTLTGYPFLFLPILAVCNALNLIYGEFSEPEMRRLLQFYYETNTARVFKFINAAVLVCVFGGVFFYWNQASRTIAETLGLGFVLGVAAGCFIVTLAHDLLHGMSKTERGTAGLLLLLAGMPYFATDHLLGHHRYVGLPEDKTTAKLGQPFYHYFFSSLGSRWWHSYFKPYPMPAELRKRVFRTNIRMLLFNLLLVGLILALATQPVMLLTLYLTQSFIAILLYEMINYIQHYGLKRNGEGAEVQAAHSWNCYFKYTNYILFLLPLHSQHHLHYQPGKEIPMGPRMPYVYFVMVFMALVPPLWFHKMNPLVQKIARKPRTLRKFNVTQPT